MIAVTKYRIKTLKSRRDPPHARVSCECDGDLLKYSSEALGRSGDSLSSQ